MKSLTTTTLHSTITENATDILECTLYSHGMMLKSETSGPSDAWFQHNMLQKLWKFAMVPQWCWMANKGEEKEVQYVLHVLPILWCVQSGFFRLFKCLFGTELKWSFGSNANSLFLHMKPSPYRMEYRQERMILLKETNRWNCPWSDMSMIWGSGSICTRNFVLLLLFNELVRWPIPQVKHKFHLVGSTEFSALYIINIAHLSMYTRLFPFPQDMPDAELRLFTFHTYMTSTFEQLKLFVCTNECCSDAVRL